MENGIFIELKDCSIYGKKTYQRIAKYLLDYSKDYRFLKISDVAKQAYTSNSTVVRFAKEFGYSGFPELKIELGNQNKIFLGTDNSEIAELNYKKHYDAITKSFRVTQTINTQEVIMQISNLIIKTQKIDLYAVGETNVIAQDFQLKLVRIGFSATAEQDTHTKHFIASNSSKKNLAIGISYSGTTASILLNLKEAKKVNATTVLICKTGVKKPLYVDIILHVFATESGARVFSATSRFSILYLLDIIYHEVINTNQKKYHNKLEKTRIKRK